MTNTAFLAQQDRCHADIVRALHGNEDGGMTIRTVQPFSVLLMRVDDIGHAALDLSHDVQIEHDRHLVRIQSVVTGIDAPLLDGGA